MNSNKSDTLINVVVWILIAVYILFFSVVSFFRYYSFDYRQMDLALNGHIMWNMVHGSLHTSILGANFLGHHAHLILFLFAPVYLLFQSPLTLLFLQALFLGISAYPIFLIAKTQLNRAFGLGLVLIYLVYPGLWYTNSFEFHVTAFSTAFLSFMFYHFTNKQFKRFLLFMVLSLLCQENIPLLIIPFGIYALFMKRKSKWSLVPISLAGFWFLAVVGKMIPYFNNNTLCFIGRYKHFGTSIPEIVKYFVVHPLETIGILFSKDKVLFIIQLFSPVCFFSLIDPMILTISLVLIQHLASSNIMEHSIKYHYTAEIIPFIFVAAIWGIKRFIKSPVVQCHLSQKFIITCLLIVGITMSISFGPHLSLICDREEFKRDIWDYQKARFVEMIPCDARVVATFEFLPWLTARENLYSFHYASQGFSIFTRKPYDLPEEIDYALIDFNDLFTFNLLHIPGTTDVNARKILSSTDWGVVDMIGSIALFKKKNKSRYSLYEVLDSPPLVRKLENVVINNELEFVGYDVNEETDIFQGKQVECVLYWKALKNIQKEYGVFIEIADARGNIQYELLRSICYRIFPTYDWSEEDVVKESCNLLIPKTIKEQECSILIRVFAKGRGDMWPVNEEGITEPMQPICKITL